MKIFIVLSCVIATSFALSHLDYQWDEWKANFAKVYYDDREAAVRRYIWEKNLAFVDQHNKETRAGLHSYTVGMNKFADMETAEFTKTFLGLLKEKVGAPGCVNSSFYVIDKNYGAPPTEVDWRAKGYVTRVKNQAACGSCWAFSTTGSVEGQHFAKTGELVSLSEQNLMDCSKPEGDFSCEGGMMDLAFEYIIKNGGVDTEASYPYLAMDEQTCKFNKKTIGATVKSCVDVSPSMDEKALQKAVANVGPISVAIDASKQTFHLYSSGVYDEPTCSSTLLDHGVLAVGYGTDGGKDYWLVKNSWGANWGMEGYIKMSRNMNNQCGIATSASYPIV